MVGHDDDPERAVPVVGAAEMAAPHVARTGPCWQVVVPAVALLAGAAWVVYGTALRAPFVFDDRVSVVQNPSIVRLWPLLGTAGESGPLTPAKNTITAGRPLVNLSLALNYHFGRLNPSGYHAFNLVVHIMSALLVWAIVGRTLRLEYFGGRFAQAAGPLSLMVAMVWELHPLQTEAVEYVSQRTELMMAFFYLGTLYASLRYWTSLSPGGRRVWLVLATVACLLGMACKEVMVTAPVIVLLFERTFIAGSFRQSLRQSWALYLGLGLGWLLLLALNVAGPRSASAGFHTGVAAHLWWLTQAKVLWIYLKLVVWPWPLVAHYDMPYLGSFAVAWPWVFLGALVAIATLVLVGRREPAGFLGAWVLLILSPTLVVPIPSEMAAERRMYLPLAGLVSLAIIGGYALVVRLRRAIPAGAGSADDRAVDADPPAVGAAAENQSASNWSPTRLTVIAALAVASVFGVVSIRRLAAYRDLVTFWQDTAVHQPDNAVVLVSLGAALTGAGRHDEAINALQHAAQLQTDSAALGIHKQLGAALSAAGRSQEAIEELQIALRVDPDAPGVDRVLGVNLLNAGQTTEAIEHLRRAVRLQPNDAGIHDNLGVALLNGQFMYEAITCFEQALRLDPENVGPRFNLALAYAKAGRPSEAIVAADDAAKLARTSGASDATAQIEGWLRAYRASLSSP